MACHLDHERRTEQCVDSGNGPCAGTVGDLGLRAEEAGPPDQGEELALESRVAACVAEPRCEAVTFWGITDAHSWIDGFFGPDDPLLFDEQYRAKPAFFGVQDAFLGR